MTEKNFSESLLLDLEKNLHDIGKEYPKSALTIDKLLSLITAYKKENTVSCPDVLKTLKTYIDNLSFLPGEAVKPVSDVAKQCCRECMFHMDDCFINIIFIIFKSIETSNYLEPKKIRPTLRIDAFQNDIRNFSNSVRRTENQ